MNTTPDRKRTSEILQAIADGCGEDNITMKQFTNQMGDRAFALVILVFSLPNSLPIPGIPGFSTITGLPILFIGFQMLMRREVFWLPQWISKKEFSGASLKKVLNYAIPWVIKMEKYLKPRWNILLCPLGECVIGFVIVALTCILVLPIPGGNFLPGLSITILALSFLEKDGLVTAFGLAFATASFVFMVGLVKLVIVQIVGWISGMIA